MNVLLITNWCQNFSKIYIKEIPITKPFLSVYCKFWRSFGTDLLRGKHEYKHKTTALILDETTVPLTRIEIYICWLFLNIQYIAKRLKILVSNEMLFSLSNIAIIFWLKTISDKICFMLIIRIRVVFNCNETPL